MAGYRLRADEDGDTYLEPFDLFAWPFENGPGDFKGVGGAVMGDATRVMLMRFEPGSRPGFHRALPSFGILLAGELVVNDSSGGEAVLHPGDAIRVEALIRDTRGTRGARGARGGQGGWRLGNRGSAYALLALVQMPPSPSAEVAEA